MRAHARAGMPLAAVVLVMGLPALASADPPSSAVRSAPTVVVDAIGNTDVEEVSQAQEQRSWIARHPALVGALVGAGAGAGVGYGLGQECIGQEVEPCSSKGEAAVVGAGIYAGIGAFVGWIVGRATK